MSGGGDTSAWLFVMVASFVLLFGAIIWLTFRLRRSLDAWLDRKIESEGWLPEPEESPIAPDRSRWFAILNTVGFGPLSGRNMAAIDRLAVNPGPRPLEAAFILARVGGAATWRLRPRRRWPRQQMGVGLVARLPRRVPAPLLFLPQPAAGPPLWQWMTGLDLPAVAVGDDRVNETWTAFSDQPDAAAAVLERESGLRDALVAIAQRVLGHEWRESRLPLARSVRVGRTPRVNLFALELAGERAYLFAGPKAVNQDPFPALEEAARLVADALSSDGRRV